MENNGQCHHQAAADRCDLRCGARCFSVHRLVVTAPIETTADMSRVNRNAFREPILVIPNRSRRTEATGAEARSEGADRGLALRTIHDEAAQRPSASTAQPELR